MYLISHERKVGTASSKLKHQMRMIIMFALNLVSLLASGCVMARCRSIEIAVRVKMETLNEITCTCAEGKWLITEKPILTSFRAEMNLQLDRFDRIHPVATSAAEGRR